MKGTILYAEYDEGTGVSTVTKQTKYGTFTRTARVHPDDIDIANRYDGCYFAEMKCDIAAYQERAKFMRERYKGALHVLNVIAHADEQSGIGFWPDDIERQVCVMYDNMKQAYETYHILKDSYYALVENTLRQRREMRERIEKKRRND